MQNHQYSLSDVNNMMPWEREIYLQMLMDQLRDQKEEAQRQNMNG
tara:strand:- start:5256 stop:5390 length:135 start_codon:yes stop_codon:yes gene_type:complete